MKKKSILVLTLVLLFSYPSFAQRDFEEGEDLAFKDRLYFGGNFGLQLGNVTFIDVSPLVGFMINTKFSAGVGITYQYYSYTTQISASQTGKVDFNVYGGRVFGRYNLTEQLFAYTEYERISIPYLTADYSEQREWIPAFYVGGGYVQRFGKRGGIGITALYNLLYSNRSLSNNPVTIRVGFFI